MWRFAMCPLLCLFTGALPRRRFWSSMRRSLSAIIALRLTQSGFEVLAENGYQALAMVRAVQRPIHLALIDIRMPKMSGPGSGRAAGLPRASRTTAHRAHLGRWAVVLGYRGRAQCMRSEARARRFGAAKTPPGIKLPSRGERSQAPWRSFPVRGRAGAFRDG